MVESCSMWGNLRTRRIMPEEKKNVAKSGHATNHVLVLEMTKTHARQPCNDVVSEASRTTDNTIGNNVERNWPGLCNHCITVQVTAQLCIDDHAHVIVNVAHDKFPSGSSSVPHNLQPN